MMQYSTKESGGDGLYIHTYEELRYDPNKILRTFSGDKLAVENRLAPTIQRLREQSEPKEAWLEIREAPSSPNVIH